MNIKALAEKSPIKQAREFLKAYKMRLPIACSHIDSLIEYAESLERKVKELEQNDGE